MSAHRDHLGRIDSGEYTTFENALKKILSVPRSKIKSKLDSEKRKRVKSSASHAATSKD
jgi:hypothetical protein